MFRRFTVLVFIVLLGGGAFAEVSAHAGEQDCDVPSCCEMNPVADCLLGSVAAPPCCVIGDSPPDKTGPVSSLIVPAPGIAPAHPSTSAQQLPHFCTASLLHRYLPQTSAFHSPPVYILHVTFLI